MSPHLALSRYVVDPLSVWAERDERARLVLEDDLSICWSNHAAGQLIARCELFQLLGNRLVVRDARWSQAFQKFVRSSGDEASTLCISQESDEHILCTAVELGDGGERRFTGVTLRCGLGAMPVHSAALRSAFNLTSSEQRIVETMLAGRTAEEVSADLGIAIGTVRVHIRHIYAKLDVASREAMFHKLTPFLLEG